MSCFYDLHLSQGPRAERFVENLRYASRDATPATTGFALDATVFADVGYTICV